MPNSPSEGRATARGWTMPSHERACEPQKWDILFGRTNESINHVGNVTFRTVVGISLIAYETLPTSFRAYRHEFLVSVVESIKRGNGRFLKKNDAGGWIEVYDEKAREKVRQQYHNSIIKPHIMQAFMAVDNLSLLPFFYSPSDFNWSAMVEACERELHSMVNMSNQIAAIPENEEEIQSVNSEKGIDSDFDAIFGSDFDTLLGDGAVFDDLDDSSFYENEEECEFSNEIEGSKSQ